MKWYFGSKLGISNALGEGMACGLKSMTNRAIKRGDTSLSQTIRSGFYGPWNRGETQALLRKGLDDNLVEQGEYARNQVAGGSNLIDYRTDPGMRNEVHGDRVAKFGGEYFADMNGDPQWANQQR